MSIPLYRRVRTALKTRTQVARLTKFYGQFVGRGDLVFDVGANVGDRTAAFARLGARVVALEPQHSCRAHLEKRFRSCERVEVVGSAVGAEPGEATLYCGDLPVLATLSPEWITATARSNRFHGHEWHESETVPVTTLDMLVAAHGSPEFCKIDVEGYELEALNGLSRRLNVVSFEIAREFFTRFEECVAHLAELGASRFCFSEGESLELTDWTGQSEIIDMIDRHPRDLVWGDVYARFD